MISIGIVVLGFLPHQLWMICVLHLLSGWSGADVGSEDIKPADDQSVKVAMLTLETSAAHISPLVVQQCSYVDAWCQCCQCSWCQKCRLSQKLVEHSFVIWHPARIRSGILIRLNSTSSTLNLILQTACRQDPWRIEMSRRIHSCW